MKMKRNSNKNEKAECKTARHDNVTILHPNTSSRLKQSIHQQPALFDNHKSHNLWHTAWYIEVSHRQNHFLFKNNRPRTKNHSEYKHCSSEVLKIKEPKGISKNKNKNKNKVRTSLFSSSNRSVICYSSSAEHHAHDLGDTNTKPTKH